MMRSPPPRPPSASSRRTARWALSKWRPPCRSRAFRANLSTLREDVLALRPQPGEAAAAASLRRWLGKSTLLQPGAARRLQDPLSFRNAVQAHGAVHFALEMLERIVAVQLNSAPDNPAVLVATGEVVSNGNFLSPHLTVALEAVSRALCMAANLQAARIARLLSDRFSGLTLYLSPGSASPNGLAPLLKIAESLLSGMTSRAAPAHIWPSAGADGVEDVMTQSLQAAQSLGAVVERARTDMRRRAAGRRPGDRPARHRARSPARPGRRPGPRAVDLAGPGARPAAGPRSG
jgi:histidine ammonia-lyase